MKNATTKRKKRNATRRLIAAMDRMILAAKQAEQAKKELLESQGGNKDDR